MSIDALLFLYCKVHCSVCARWMLVMICLYCKFSFKFSSDAHLTWTEFYVISHFIHSVTCHADLAIAFCWLPHFFRIKSKIFNKVKKTVRALALDCFSGLISYFSWSHLPLLLVFLLPHYLFFSPSREPAFHLQAVKFVVSSAHWTFLSDIFAWSTSIHLLGLNSNFASSENFILIL